MNYIIFNQINLVQVQKSSHPQDKGNPQDKLQQLVVHVIF